MSKKPVQCTINRSYKVYIEGTPIEIYEYIVQSIHVAAIEVLRKKDKPSRKNIPIIKEL